MKRLTFAFVIVLSLFVLGGCDKLLEGFFPEDTDSGEIIEGDADYSVAVSIEYDRSLANDWNFGPGNTSVVYSPIRVAFIPFYDSYNGFAIDYDGIEYVTLWTNSFTEDTDGDQYRTTVEFNTWNYSTYKVLAWYDHAGDDNNLLCDEYDEDPGMLATINSSSDYWVDFRTMNPQNAGIQMNCQVGPGSEINFDQLTANPYAVYAAGGLYPYVYINSSYGNSAPVNTTVSLDSYGSGDSDGWITSSSWSITDPNSLNVLTGYGQYISYYFDTLGTYTVILTVTDNQGNVTSATHYLSVYATASIPLTVMPGTDTYEIDVQVVSDYQFYISTPGYYYINWEDLYQNSGAVAYTGDMAVSAYDSTNNFYFQNVDSGYLEPFSIYVGDAQAVTIRIDPTVYSNPGTCRVWITPQ